MIDSFDNKRKWIGYEVITERGVLLGWVKQIKLDAVRTNQATITIAIIPIYYLPDILSSTYEFSGSTKPLRPSPKPNDTAENEISLD